jgi:phosphoribosylformylglycinamidine synthase
MRGGVAPTAELAREMRLIDLLVTANKSQLFQAAHDLSQGGLTSTIVEMVLRYGVGATLTIDNPGVALVSETPGRVLVAIKGADVSTLESLATSRSITLSKIGVTGGDALVVNGATISLSELRSAHTETFKKLFG